MEFPIQQEMIKQLGGNKFTVMTGAKYSAEDQTLTVKFKGSAVANIMWIALNSLDLYNVKIAKYRGMNVKVVEDLENIGCEDLVPIFEKTTGLHTKLFYH